MAAFTESIPVQAYSDLIQAAGYELSEFKGEGTGGDLYSVHLNSDSGFCRHTLCEIVLCLIKGFSPVIRTGADGVERIYIKTDIGIDFTNALIAQDLLNKELAPTAAKNIEADACAVSNPVLFTLTRLSPGLKPVEALIVRNWLRKPRDFELGLVRCTMR